MAVEGDGADALGGVDVGQALDGGGIEGASDVGTVLGGEEANLGGGFSGELERELGGRLR